MVGHELVTKIELGFSWGEFSRDEFLITVWTENGYVCIAIGKTIFHVYCGFGFRWGDLNWAEFPTKVLTENGPAYISHVNYFYMYYKLLVYRGQI